MAAHYAADPATGEICTLSELARRHGLSVATVFRRHQRGLEGVELVETVSIRERTRQQHAKAKREAERYAERLGRIVAISAVGLRRPFKAVGTAREFMN